MLNLVYGSSSSSYVDCVVFFDDECLLFDGLGFVYPRARPHRSTSHLWEFLLLFTKPFG